MSRLLQNLDRLSRQTDMPIYHQLRVEFAARQLVASFTEAQRAAYMAPEAVLDRIRLDQQVLDWRETWARERAYAQAAEEGL